MLYQVLDIVTDFFNPLANLAGLFLLLLGVIWIVYCLQEANRRKSWRKLTKIDEWDFSITLMLKVITICGFFVGIVSIIIGGVGLVLNLPPSLAYSTQTANSVNIFTSIFLIILGIFTFLKPINDLPIASMVGLAAASLVTVVIAFLIPDAAITLIANFINPKYILIGVFLVIFAIVAVTVKFYISGVMFLSKIVSWPPFALIIALFCFLQAILLLVFGISVV